MSDDYSAFSHLVLQEKPLKGRATDALVRCLEEYGVKYVFGVPGEENLDFLDSLRLSAERHKIQLVITRHEQGAGMMAATVGRLTGCPGVCLSTLGPGATNFATALAYAQLAGMPMFVVTGQKPIRHSKQGQFQIVDVVGHFRPLTKLTKQIVDPGLVPSLVRECFRTATEEKPGPVHLELPEDIAGMEVPESNAHIFPAHPVRRPVAEAKAIAAAVQLLLVSKRPLLCVGAGANRKRTVNTIHEVMRTCDMYAVCTQMGKGVVDETLQTFLGCAALSAKDLVHVAVQHADLIIHIGHDSTEKPPFFMQHGGGPIVVHVNFFAAKVDEVYFPHLEVIGDVGNALWNICQELKQAGVPKWDNRGFQVARQHIQDKIYSSVHIQSDSFPMTIQRVVSDVRRAVPNDGIICLDNGMYKIHFARQYPAYQPNTILLDNALATMGAGLPSAIGAKLAHPEKKVMAICGDGGFMMNSQELETAVRLKLHLVVLILNDSSFGMIRWKQKQQTLPDWGLQFSNPDFTMYAKAYGAIGHTIASAESFANVLDNAFKSGAGVHVIDVPISYLTSEKDLEDDLPKFVEEASKAVKAAVEKPMGKANEKAEGKAEGMGGDKSGAKEEEEADPKIKSRWPFYLAGKPQQPNADLPVTNKYTSKVVCRVALASKQDMETATQAASEAAKSMAALGVYERKAILSHCAKRFRERHAELSHALAVEAGKPIADSELEAKRLIETFEIAVEECGRATDGAFESTDTTARNKGTQMLTKRFPIGPVAMISPFNFPLNLAAHKVAPAIAAGCPFVLKPASRTPLGALIIAEVLAECPLMPPKAFSVLPCTRDAGEILTVDDRFKLLSFTGSPAVGWDLKARSGKKKVVLELGGNAACIVDEIPKEGLEHLINRIVFGAFYQSGQSCISTQRLYVRSDIYGQVVPALAKRVGELVSGDPLDRNTFVGPMISAKEASKISNWVDEAVTKGATILAGTGKPFPTHDALVGATLLEKVDESCQAWEEEAFGPLLCVRPFDEFKSTVAHVNRSKYGIHCGLFTSNLDRMMYAFENLEVGGLICGDVPSIRLDAMPYGGVKESGLGREGVKYAIEDMTEMRALLIKNAGTSV